MGSGFLISPNILMTNAHVLNTAAVAGNATAIFNFQTGTNGEMLSTRSFRCNPSRLYLSSPVTELDCAFVWVDGQPGADFGSIPLNRTSFQVAAEDFVNIIQHPAGEPKQLALQENQVEQVAELVIRYRTDTMPGSSGSAVFNNQWGAVALHHASKAVGGGTTLNEGIRMPAIAAWLERVQEAGGAGAASASELLLLFEGTDTELGFFGTLGRTVANEGTGPESVVKSYAGTSADIDVGFWNVEWFTNRYQQKTPQVAEVMVKMNLDIWALSESSPNAAYHLKEYLAEKYDLDFGVGVSEPNSRDGKQSTTVLWNKRTVTGDVIAWPADIPDWFRFTSHGRQPGDFADLGLEAVDGKIFDRYPGLFSFKAQRDNDQDPFTFLLVPLHLKAMNEGSKRRQLASEILAAAVSVASAQLNEQDWIIGGDYNAELASGDFSALNGKGLVPLSAEDEDGGAFTYIKGPKSLIDHVFLSANLASTFGADDYFIVARDKEVPGYVSKISDHRPVVVRLSLHDQEHEAVGVPGVGLTGSGPAPESLVRALRELRAGGSAKGAGA